MQSYSWTSTCASGTTSKISPNLHVCNFINILCCVDQHRTQQPCWGRNVKRICRMTVCNKLAEAFVLRWVHPVCLDSGSLWIWLLCQCVLPPPPHVTVYPPATHLPLKAKVYMCRLFGLKKICKYLVVFLSTTLTYLMQFLSSVLLYFLKKKKQKRLN